MNTMYELETLLRSVTEEDIIKLDEDRAREDLMGLYTDIRLALKDAAPAREKIIYEYAKLLQEELELYSPQFAFEAGALLATNPQGNDDDPQRAFMRYACRIGFDPKSKILQNKIKLMFEEIITLLGDASGLIGDFTEQYRSCNGFAGKHLHRFFNMGYEHIRREMEAAS